MKTKKLTPEDVDKMPSSYRMPGLSPELEAWLDEMREQDRAIERALASVHLSRESITYTNANEVVIYVQDADERRGLLVLPCGKTDEQTWPAQVVWKGVVSEEEGAAIERGLVERGCAAVRDFGGLWISGQGAAVYGPVKDDGDNN